MAGPGKADLMVTVGDDWTCVVRMRAADEVTPIVITGRTYAAHVRRDQSRSGAPDAAMACSVVSGPDGEMRMGLTAAQTSALGAGVFRWDLEETASGVVTTVLSGVLELCQDVTHG